MFWPSAAPARSACRTARASTSANPTASCASAAAACPGSTTSSVNTKRAGATLAELLEYASPSRGTRGILVALTICTRVRRRSSDGMSATIEGRRAGCGSRISRKNDHSLGCQTSANLSSIWKIYQDQKPNSWKLFQDQKPNSKRSFRGHKPSLTP